MKKTAHLGLFLSLALICSYIESLIPFSFGIPGVKLGLTNIVILIALYYMDTASAAAVSILRIILCGFLFGNLFGILYSLAGGACSLFCMALLKRTGVGGIAHNLGQIIVAAAVVENVNLFYYFPVLFAAGTVTGILIGIAAQEVLLRLPPGHML